MPGFGGGGVGGLYTFWPTPTEGRGGGGVSTGAVGAALSSFIRAPILLIVLNLPEPGIKLMASVRSCGSAMIFWNRLVPVGGGGISGATVGDKAGVLPRASTG